MESLILLVLVLIIVSLFVISRCSLKCRCKNENYLTPFLQLPFNDHPVLRRRRYQHTIVPVSDQGTDTNIYTSANCDGSDCKCTQCDDPSPGKCVSRTCDDMSAATSCCNSQGSDCSNCNADNDSSCDYQKWCKGNFNDNTGNGGVGDGNSDKIWFIIGISVLVAVALGVAFYFWMTTKHVG